MKKVNLKMALVAMTALAAVACGKEDDGNTTVEDINILADATYTLTAPLVIVDGQTLTIEAGARIEATTDELAYILVEQGGKIIARGTAAKPIVMTSAEANPAEGDWGGIHICGKAPINSGLTNNSEVGTKPYGGTVSDDDSGILEYVIVEYAGFQQSNEKECNGFSFYGVGSGTTVDHCVAYKGSDDGFEFFGGTVNASNILSIGNKDDLFDWTEGWSGCGQFWIGDQIDNGCDQTMEGDNSKSDYTLAPISCPTIANVTLIGDDFSGDTSGALLRNGTHFKIYNTLASGKSTDIKLGDNNGGGEYPTDASLTAGTSIFKNVYSKSAISAQSGTNVTGVTASTGTAYTYGTTVACDNHGLTTVNGFTFITAAYAGAGDFVAAANAGAGSWGAIVTAYLAE